MQTATRWSWRAALVSGLIGGLVFLMAEMALVPMFGHGSPWLPVRMIAAIALGPDALPPPSGFDAIVLIVALIVHFALSSVYATFRVWLVEGRHGPMADAARGSFGLAIYVVNFYGFTAMFPWFADARSWISVVTHIAWGIVVPIAYSVLREREGRGIRSPRSAGLSRAPAARRSAVVASEDR